MRGMVIAKTIVLWVALSALIFMVWATRPPAGDLYTVPGAILFTAMITGFGLMVTDYIWRKL